MGETYNEPKPSL